MGKTKAMAATILIKISSNGEMETSGPFDDPILFLGMLELAKQRYLSKLTTSEVLSRIQTEIVSQAKAAESSIIRPDGGRFRKPD